MRYRDNKTQVIPTKILGKTFIYVVFKKSNIVDQSVDQPKISDFKNWIFKFSFLENDEYWPALQDDLNMFEYNSWDEKLIK